jgi:hypothetical protein
MTTKTTKPTPKKRARATSTAATRAADWGEKFLTELARRGIVKYACAAARIHRSTAYDRKLADPAFAARWADAVEEAADVLEREMFRRAHDGVKKPVFGSLGPGLGSGEIGYVVEYSDTLLIFALKGMRPDKYREKHEIVGKGGGPIKTARELSDEELAAIAAGVSVSSVSVTPDPRASGAGIAQPPASA